MKDFAVIGSGVGGSSIAALLNTKGYDVALFEKEPYLGGCSSSFSHKGFTYNTGATTLAGYDDGLIVKEMFDTIGFKPDLIETDPSIVIVQGQKVTPRYMDFEKFFTVLEKNYPHSNNREFWELVYWINDEFYKMNNYFYDNSNIFSKIRSLTSFIPLLFKFQKYLRVNAHRFIKNIFGEIKQEYVDFLEAQVRIVAQAELKDVNFLTAALALGYTFEKNHYVVGGFSSLFDDLTQNIPDIHRREEVKKIIRYKEYFEIQTKKNSYLAKKVILNSTVYDSAKLFEDAEVKDYYKRYEKLNNHQSSFMLYMTIKTNKMFFHHYQIIEDQKIKNTLSNALFVSISDKDDNEISEEGCYSITASIHTDSRFWEDKTCYKEQKKELEAILIEMIMKNLSITEDEVLQSFSATSKTFQHYIKRSQLGGNAITMKNFLPRLPGNNTPIKNLYNVGDSVYAAQGWPGVMLGVKNLMRLLDV